ncbi:MAG: hypothetical protein JNL57_02075 [Bacteroidetes bacterium]|nr:hypothetical protein [Bacteroidota bacterium]
MKYLLLLIFVGFCSSLSASAPADTVLTGKWQVTNQEESSLFFFNPDGYAGMVYESDTIGGKEYDIEGVKYAMKYKVNYKTKPMQMDLLIYKKATMQLVNTMPAIFEFLPTGGMKLMINYSENKRPAFFMQESTLLLDRAK